MKNLLFILLALSLAACTEPVVEKPEDLIPEDTMVDIYFDISLFNASNNSGYDKFSAHSIDRWEYIFKKYDIDSARLATSGLYYAAKPVQHERIYTRVEERLDSLKKVFDEEIGAPNDKSPESVSGADSLKLATPDTGSVPDPVPVDSL